MQDRLNDLSPAITWTVTRFRDQIGPGDTIFIWETGRDRAIRAVLRAESVPEDMPEMESEQDYWADLDTEVRRRVRASITHRNISLRHDLLRSIPGLGNPSSFMVFSKERISR